MLRGGQARPVPSCSILKPANGIQPLSPADPCTAIPWLKMRQGTTAYGERTDEEWCKLPISMLDNPTASLF